MDENFRLTPHLASRSSRGSLCPAGLRKLPFKCRQCTLDDLAKGDAMHEFSSFETQSFAFDDCVEAVVRALRNARIK